MPDPYPFKTAAINQSKKGGDLQRAQVYATLHLAEVLVDLVDEVRSIGAEAFPLHIVKE